MTSEQLCYWLQGYIEIQRATGQPIVITDNEVRVIEDHLKLVMDKKTPDREPKVETGKLEIKIPSPPLRPLQFYGGGGYGQSVSVPTYDKQTPGLVMPMTGQSC